MTPVRCAFWVLLLGAGFALFAGGASAQPPLPKKDSTAISKVTGYKEAGRGGIPEGDIKEARENFAKYAKYYVDVVAHPAVYKTPQEFKVASPNAVPVPVIDGPDGILYDIGRFMKEPTLGSTAVGPDQAAYVREFGLAFDNGLKELIEKHPEPIVRVNAARVLAHVCRGGSTAHYPTLTTLIANANTRTEVKYHLFHAAANLLAAADPLGLKTRNHPGQTDDPKPVAALVKALDDCVNNPALLVTGLPNNKTDGASEDQLAVVGMVRRQAVRALAQFRYASVQGPDGKTIYPVHTLCRVALSDPALAPAPGPAEAAEAVIGICNMAPVVRNGNLYNPVKYNADAAVEAVTAGLITFASPRAADKADRRLPWRTYALRLGEALTNWRLLFDPDLDPTAPGKADLKKAPAAVRDFVAEVVPRVLAPMDRVGPDGRPDLGANVDIEGLRARLTALRGNPQRSPLLFPEARETSIDFGPAKK